MRNWGDNEETGDIQQLSLAEVPTGVAGLQQGINTEARHQATDQGPGHRCEVHVGEKGHLSQG